MDHPSSPEEINKPEITNYIDYRSYLRDFFKYKKTVQKNFSQRQLASSLSLSSPGFMTAVVQGKKNLSQSLLTRLLKFLKMEERNSRYFETLVHFNQAKWMEEKNHYFSQLSKFKSSQAEKLHARQYKYYTKWYYSAVWAYFAIHTNENNPGKICREIFPNITPKQVEEAIDLLVDLKLIEKQANGFKTTSTHIVSEDPFRTMISMQYNLNFLDMAKHALQTVPSSARQYNTLMLTASERGIKAVKERIKSFQEEIRGLVEQDSEEDRIYTIGIQLFPNSNNYNNSNE